MYNMNYKKGGMALIFDFGYFENDKRGSNGCSKIDCDKFEASFTSLGFAVRKCLDLDKSDLEKVIDEYSNQDFSDYSCIACILMTHGEENLILTPKFERKNEFEPFQNNKSLEGKPKIFIINTCKTFKPQEETKQDRCLTSVLVAHQKHLKRTDCIFVHSLIYGTSAFFDKFTGSIFVDILCKKLDSNGKIDPLSKIVQDAKYESLKVVSSLEEKEDFKSEIIINTFYSFLGSVIFRPNNST